jgi:hypothetical protein
MRTPKGYDSTAVSPMDWRYEMDRESAINKRRVKQFV